MRHTALQRQWLEAKHELAALFLQLGRKQTVEFLEQITLKIRGENVHSGKSLIDSLAGTM